jgi:hypothetical protein
VSTFDDRDSLEARGESLPSCDEPSGMCDCTELDSARGLVGDTWLPAVRTTDRAGVLFDCALAEVAEMWHVMH